MKTHTDHLHAIIKTLASKKAPTRGMGVPLWGVVADLAGIGSTSACELCTLLGIDPHEYVLEPAWLDPARQTISEVCPKCGVVVNVETGCAWCDDDRKDDREDDREAIQPGDYRYYRPADGGDGPG